MLDNEPTGSQDAETAAASDAERPTADSPAAPATSRTRRRATRSAGPPKPIDTTAEPASTAPATSTGPADAGEPATAEAPRRTRSRKKAAAPAAQPASATAEQPASATAGQPAETTAAQPAGASAARSAGVAAATETVARSTEATGAGTATDTAATTDTAAAATVDSAAATDAAPAPAPRKRASRRRTAGTDAAATTEQPPAPTAEQPATPGGDQAAAPGGTQPAPTGGQATEPAAEDSGGTGRGRGRRRAAAPVPVLFVAPEPTEPPKPPAERGDAEPDRDRTVEAAEPEPEAADADPDADGGEDGEGRHRRRRGRRGRGRGKGAAEEAEAEPTEAARKPEGTKKSEGTKKAEAAKKAGPDEAAQPADESGTAEGEGGRRRRRRRRRGASGDAEPSPDDPPNTVVRVREPRKASDEVQGVSGSTRLEAKRQRRRDGREQRRTRPPILSESEFLARREAVDRSMVVRQVGDRTQIAVLEDNVLVEHYVSQSTSNTMIGNVYLGKVQNVLPSMEAAFIDIGRGRNAVLYAGEVNWDSAGLEGRTRAIEKALKPGDSVLVQVTKDPIGHKGARLTSHVTLSGRHLVYVPGGHASGISRKLPDTERKRLRDALKRLVPEHAGVIVRTAAEGASEDELSRDVTRLQALWETIESRAKTASAPSLLYEEPDLVIRVVRDLFNEDFKELVIAGNESWDLVHDYVEHVSPDLVDRLHRYTGSTDVFAELRIDEQLLKALDRKVYLPSGGSLVIDRTEAMTVIDVNTGKFIGSGGNLEETVTRNNLEAAEEIVRQLRLRDVGGIIVIDFIDMVLESNRELVLRRLTECLGRDRTKHQVTEITSLGLVQMTRKRVGQPLIDAFSETCEHCKGRGVIIHLEPTTGGKSGKGTDGQKPTEEKSKRRRKDKAADKPEKAPAAEEPGTSDGKGGKGGKAAKKAADAPEPPDTPAPATAAEPDATGTPGDGSAPAGEAEAAPRRKRTGTRRRKAPEAEPVSADS